MQIRDISKIKELRKLKKLNTPQKIQDFLDKMPINKELKGETCTSPLLTLRRNKAHCMEGALVAALALWLNGQKPLIMDLKTTDDDFDHIVALYKKDGFWGGITKTSHGVLRYREPIYRDLRELAVSFFHEYFLDNGKKTLRAYSEPFDLSKWKENWVTCEDDLWDLEKAIDKSPHHKLLTNKQIRNLRKASKTEVKAGMIKE